MTRWRQLWGSSPTIPQQAALASNLLQNLEGPKEHCEHPISGSRQLQNSLAGHAGKQGRAFFIDTNTTAQVVVEKRNRDSKLQLENPQQVPTCM